MVSVQGLALGTTVKTEDIPQLQNLPLHLTAKGIGVADSTGAMAIIGISSEDNSGQVFGNYRFDLSVYRFEDGKVVAFLIDKEAVPLGLVTEVTRAKFGDQVDTPLENYVATRHETWQLSQGLLLEAVVLLAPAFGQGPVIIAREPAWLPVIT